MIDQYDNSRSGLYTNEIVNQTRRFFLRILGVTASVGTVLWLLVFFILHVPGQDLGANLVFFFIGVLILLLSYRKNIGYGSWFATCVAFFSFITFNLFPNETSPEKALSSLTLFPLIAFFLLERTVATIFTSVYLLVCATILFFNLNSLSISRSTSIQALTNISITTVIIYFYLYINSKAQQLLTKKEQEREHVITELNEQISKRQTAEDLLTENLNKIQNQKIDLERLNTLMIGREVAMAELKEKLRKYEPV